MNAMPPLLALAAGRKARPRKAPRILPRESVLQVAVANTLRDHCLPEWKWTHFAAGEARSVITGARLKRFGLQKGWPDFLFLAPGGKLRCLELKRVGEQLTEEQADFRFWCFTNAVPFAIARTIDEVLLILDAWGCLRIRLK